MAFELRRSPVGFRVHQRLANRALIISNDEWKWLRWGKFFRLRGTGCHSVGHSSVIGASGSLLSRHFFLCPIALAETLPLKHLNFGQSEPLAGGTTGAPAPLPKLCIQREPRRVGSMMANRIAEGVVSAVACLTACTDL